MLQAAWSDHQRLGKGATSLDPKVARAKSELLRIVVSVIERKASLVGLPLGTQGASRTADGPGLDGHQGDGRQSLKSMADVVSVLEQAVDDAASVNDPAARSRLRARLGQVAAKVLEKAELEEKVEALEEIQGRGRKS